MGSSGFAGDTCAGADCDDRNALCTADCLDVAVRSLAPMLAAEKQSVTVFENGAERLCPASDVVPGTVVLIRPGERIGVDGSVIEGRSHADEAAMTGESRLIEKRPGSQVLAGAINGNGMLTVRSECAGTATHWARICRSVRQSGSSAPGVTNVSLYNREGVLRATGVVRPGNTCDAT